VLVCKGRVVRLDAALALHADVCKEALAIPTVVYIVKITNVEENESIKEQYKYFVQCTNVFAPCI
jgi:hypothetical protein